MNMRSLVTRIARDDAGQDVVEYALLAGTIAVIAAAALFAIGSQVNNVYVNRSNQLKGGGS